MRIPSATYRLQLTPSFGFKKAREILDYLESLGVTDLYASPITKAKRGSTHGYDVVEHGALNPELGSREDFDALAEDLKKRGMGLILDIVPNHMAFDGENTLLMDVLENGEASDYFDFFDMDWGHPYRDLQGRLLAPFLGNLYGTALEAGQIRLEYGEKGFTIKFFDLELPLKAESYGKALSLDCEILKDRLGEEHPDYVKFSGLLYSIKNIPSSKEKKKDRHEQAHFIKGLLRELYAGNQAVREFVDGNINAVNGGLPPPDRYRLLDELLGEQFYRFSFWKVATEEVNYRRFFNINGLISLRVEEEEVFDRIHTLALRLVEEGKATGLRVDHIDGLYDPEKYLKRLREGARDAYILVEKVLQSGEQLPGTWPVQGTTGYDFLNKLNSVFCDTSARRVFDRFYAAFSRLKTPYGELFYEKKRLIIEKHMAGDVDNLAHLLKRIAGFHRYGRDITLHGLKRAVVEVLSYFPIYRTYISGGPPSKEDRLYIMEAVTKARKKNPGLLYEIDFLGKILLLDFKVPGGEEERMLWEGFVMRFQQFTGPLMAKGFEDTLLYVYTKLLSLNEVGGSPEAFGIPVKNFHEFVRVRGERWPHSMNSTSTHDAKRGEDVRARLNVLSEMPEEWETNVRRWSVINRRHKRFFNGKYVPEKNDEYLLYQTLVGAMPFSKEERPLFAARVKDYMIKAVREAKVHTAWLKPDTDYEERCLGFIERILEPGEENRFLASFLPFQKKVSFYGMLNSLSQTLIKAASPGVPDIYQGGELWDLNLVDPDNRRPVDFEKRERFLKDMIEREVSPGPLLEELLDSGEDGRVKLFLIYRTLRARKRFSRLFEKGAYVPLEASGEMGGNIVSFGRVSPDGGLWAVVIAPRFYTRVVSQEGKLPLGEDVWKETSIMLPEGAPSSFENVITGERVEGGLTAAKALRDFPAALLIG